jgi:hypothetical protein
MNLNLEALGLTRESLTKAILSELNLSPEEAVVALAKELGVEVMDAKDYKPETAAPSAVSNGDFVPTVDGESKAAILNDEEVAILRSAGNILYGRLGNA